jgi:hypothetical protein
VLVILCVLRANPRVIPPQGDKTWAGHKDWVRRRRARAATWLMRKGLRAKQVGQHAHTQRGGEKRMWCLSAQKPTPSGPLVLHRAASIGPPGDARGPPQGTALSPPHIPPPHNRRPPHSCSVVISRLMQYARRALALSYLQGCVAQARAHEQEQVRKRSCRGRPCLPVRPWD